LWWWAFFPRPLRPALATGAYMADPPPDDSRESSEAGAAGNAGEGDPRFPEKYSGATGKGDLHIPGAGTIGMAILLVSLSVLFIASMAIFLIIRFQTTQQPPHIWPPPGMPHVPRSLWLSTVIILLASVTIQKAYSAVRRDDEGRLRGI